MPEVNRCFAPANLTLVLFILLLFFVLLLLLLVLLRHAAGGTAHCVGTSGHNAEAEQSCRAGMK